MPGCGTWSSCSAAVNSRTGLYAYKHYFLDLPPRRLPPCREDMAEERYAALAARLASKPYFSSCRARLSAFIAATARFFCWLGERSAPSTAET